MNATFPGIACPWNTTVGQALNIKETRTSNRAGLFLRCSIDVTIYQPIPLQNPDRWEVFISVYQGGMIYDYTVLYKDDQQIAKDSINLLKIHGV